MSTINLFCILLFTTCACEAYKTLVVFPVPAKSHSILGDGIVRHLLEAGHEVTYMTPFPKAQKQHPSLREIDISSKTQLIIQNKLNIEKFMKKEVSNEGITYAMALFLKIEAAFFENEEALKLFNNPKEQFDVVIVEWMFAELISGISAIFNCPYIWVSSVDPHWMVLKLIDDLPNPAYVADVKSNYLVPFSFMERIIELLKMAKNLSVQYFYISILEQKEYERLLVPIIQKRGHKVPHFDDVRYNASLMLGNSHVSIGQSLRLPQSYKAVGGYHIDNNLNPLPEDLKKLLDNAKHGIIYFSMGSNLRSKHMPTQLKTSILKMFGKLKQTIIWKFEEDLPNRPHNVHIVQWAPQQSILAHPNCILFITHGGLLSTMETIHFGKPIIGIPVFGDQFTNVDRSVRRGFAKRVDLSYDMADDLEKAVNDIIANPSYSTKAKQLSAIYHDRPVSPGKELVHWVEHVVRTGGAPHLRSPALMVPWYQKCYLDLVILVIVLLYAIKLLMKKLISCFSKKQQKKKTQ